MAVPTISRCQAQKHNRREHSAHPKHRAQHRAPSRGPFGQLLPEGAGLVVYRELAKARMEGSNDEYTLANGMGGSPVITSSRTGRVWTIDWEALIDLAVIDGIDKEH